MRKFVMAEVEIEIDDFTDEEVLDEFEARGLVQGVDNQERLREIMYAMKFQLNERAHDLMRDFLQDAFGVILP